MLFLKLIFLDVKQNGRYVQMQLVLTMAFVSVKFYLITIPDIVYVLKALLVNTVRTSYMGIILVHENLVAMMVHAFKHRILHIIVYVQMVQLDNRAK